MATQSSYVRFTRGTPQAYANLQVKDRDTLYFIAEKDATSGVLYLGDKLILGGGSQGAGSSITSLATLTDVLISNDINTESLLVFDPIANKWVNKSLEDIFEIIVPVMVGATADSDGVAGLVPVPQAGQENFILKGDGTWSDDLSNVITAVGTLIGDDVNLSVREIAENVFEEYKADLDGFDEFLEWFNDNSSLQDFQNHITKTEQVLFDQGQPGDNDYAPGLQTIVSNLNVSFAKMEGDVKEIYERLTWQELEDNDNPEDWAESPGFDTVE